MRRTGALLALLLLSACKDKAAGPGASTAPTSRASDGRDVVVTIVYGSGKKTWLEEEAAAFMAGAPRTADGRPVRVEMQAMGSGEATQAVLSGRARPTVFSPASGARRIPSSRSPPTGSAWTCRRPRPRPTRRSCGTSS